MRITPKRRSGQTKPIPKTGASRQTKPKSSKVSKSEGVTSDSNAASVDAAKEAHLIYVTDGKPGIERRRKGKAFGYFDAKGNAVRDADTLARIKSLVIPPAWEKVWICSSANGHLQAVGRDARGRKQYRYHARYRAVRDESKYGRMIAFAKALPRIHRRTSRDLQRRGLPKEKVLAAVVSVMEKTLIRVGNEEYAASNDSYGLTTLHDKHAKIRGATIHFDFRGKSGVEHEIDLDDPRLAKIVKQCQDLPGEELFQYRNEKGDPVDINSADVNEYLREISSNGRTTSDGEHFTAKDFRTWAGTVLAATALRELEAFDSNAQAKRNLMKAVEVVAKKLGNTKAVCRKCYIHPAVINAYLDGSLAKTLSREAGKMLATSIGKLRPEEAAVLGMLQQNLQQNAGS